MRKEIEAGCIEWFRPILENCRSGWIAGGAVRDYFARMNCDSDIDVFFPSQEEVNAAAVEMVNLKGARLIYSNDTAVGFVFKGREVQLIQQHYFATPQATIAAFDFTVCCCAVDLSGTYTHEHFLDDLAGRRLAINSLPFPLSTLERLQKYVRKGFQACNGTLLAIARAIQSLDLENAQANTLTFYPNGRPRFARYD